MNKMSKQMQLIGLVCLLAMLGVTYGYVFAGMAVGFQLLVHRVTWMVSGILYNVGGLL